MNKLFEFLRIKKTQHTSARSDFQSEYRINQIFCIFVTKPCSMAGLKRLNLFIIYYSTTRITNPNERRGQYNIMILTFK